MTAPVIHWFRHDLRLADNPALSAAAATGVPLITLYIFDDETSAAWSPGAASRWWLHHSLAALGENLSRRGGALTLRRGPAVDTLLQVVRESGAQQVTFTRGYGPLAAPQETEIADTLANIGVTCRRFGGALLFEPEAVATKDGRPFRVFTPFYKACRTQLIGDPVSGPDEFRPAPRLPSSDTLTDWALLPVAPNWAGGLRETWTPGEDAAKARLDTFIHDAMGRYATDRDIPGVTGTSRLSPHLHFGEIGPRQCWHRVRHALGSGGNGHTGGEAFLRELGWREFSTHLLHHWPTLPDQPFRADFAKFPWRDDEASVAAWQRGRTGYPIVDAGMRELWHTGWMHNRVRMVAASFLIKHLLIPWQRGEAWFWDTLVDADLANNAASWQWVAGCGADAAPYFRIFNPVLQGQKFDANGSYVRRWVPVLAT
ncbi:MAG: DNA photolyase family protein, partial [Alphaproteobacteria bacterium]|nr:DNA photolyase family protein [Alphaproteobacteria bacterium]